MIVNRHNVQAVSNGLKTTYNKAFDKAETNWQKVATEIPSMTAAETYTWFGRLPRMREWIGDREIQNLSQGDYTIRNKDFEMTISVGRNEIEDDTYGVNKPLAEDMGEAAKLYPEELVFGAMKSGFVEKCYDGKPFFSTEHKVGKKKVSNMGTKKLTAESYEAARADMMSRKDEYDKSFNLKPNLLVVPPALEGVGRRILKASQIEGSDNVFKDTAELLVVPELAGADDAWYLLDTTRPLKPLIFQNRKKPQFTERTALTDENVFMSNKFLFGVDARGNSGYGFWQMAYGSNGTQA
jgi:phage major head subunit gpT-like protein